MSKAEVVAYCIKLQENIHEQLKKAVSQSEAANAKIDLLSDRIDKLESDKEISRCLMKALKRQVHQNTQYSRKETIEVHGVDDDVGDGKELETKICQLLSMSGEEVCPADLHACHRLANNKQVIAKF